MILTNQIESFIRYDPNPKCLKRVPYDNHKNSDGWMNCRKRNEKRDDEVSPKF